MDKINVIFRSCDKVAAVNRLPRPFKLNKRTLIKVCFLSLVESLKDINHSIYIIGDDLSPEMSSFFSSFPATITNSVFGNSGSIRESIKIALSLPDDEWVYFCEDDYLHSDRIWYEIDGFLKFIDTAQQNENYARKHRGHGSLFIFPPDYPDRYYIDWLEPSLVYCTPSRHWRQVFNITFSFLAKVNVLRRSERIFMKASQRANDILLSKILFRKKKFLCVSPMPGLSTHMHEGTMTPLIDWRQRCDATLEILESAL